MTAPGRRFTYTDADFVEAYLGKDGMRQLDIVQGDADDNMHAFSHAPSFRDMFPNKKDYMKLPKARERQKLIDEHFGM